ncbi:MAG: MlaD family protein [Xenococcaceae cyanobacterium]
MQNTRGGGRLSPSMLQSAVGLMVLATLGCLGFLVLWVTNFSLGGRSYRATIQFPNAGGMTPGTKVSYRGVGVGQVLSIEPEPEGVAIEVEIWPADRLIPSNSLIEATQAGLVGETSIDIIPLQSLPSGGVTAKALDPDCDPAVIICNGARLQGQGKLDVNTLIRSLLRISNTLSDPEVTAAIRGLVQNASDALGDVSGVLKEVKQNGGLDNLNSTLASVDQAAEELRGLSNEVSGLIEEMRQSGGVDTLNSTLASVGEAANEIRVFMTANQTRLAATLDSIGQTSDQLRVTTSSLNPILNRVEQGELLGNLDKLSANAAEATANLRDFSTNLNDPKTILMLQQTLDSARSVFQNIQKITSDLDELTGNPEFREDLEKLIQGLSNLISSTQQLQQQVEYAQVLGHIAAEIAEVNPKGNISPATGNQPVPTKLSAPAKPEDLNSSTRN